MPHQLKAFAILAVMEVVVRLQHAGFDTVRGETLPEPPATNGGEPQPCGLSSQAGRRIVEGLLFRGLVTPT